MTHPYDDIPLIVLSGVGRSGTFALRDTLGRHPQVHSTGSENNILYDLLSAAHRNCTIEARRIAMQVDQPTYDRLFHDLILDLLWPEPRLELPLQLLAFSNLLPDRAGYLCRLYPGEPGAAKARIVYLVRNGIEVVSSRLRFGNFVELPFQQHCEVWARSVEMAEWGRDRDNFLLLRHERLLVAETLAESLDAFWTFAGLPAEPPILERLLNVCYHPTSADGASSPGRALRTRADRWRDWTDEQRRVFADVCGEAMRYWGYEMPWLAPAGLSRTAGAR
ncbi:MAG: sulfotransferase [Planctomycetota bacterium]|jgi:hypothetical protein